MSFDGVRADAAAAAPAAAGSEGSTSAPPSASQAVPPSAAPASLPPVPFQSASLYVGDLHNEVTESLLFELFNQVGPVASIRVCRDSVTRRSLGYAYVNFHDVRDAERSLDTMNFTEIKSRPCRIMWSQRDPSLRKSGVGNVFVRNLAPSVDNKGLYDTFSVFGNILSCKVATDENGVSKGYGYVHFETAEAAADAIQKFNGTLIDDVEVHVGTFVRKQERAGQADWTNLFVKQFSLTWDEEKLKSLFEAYGPVANVALMKDDESKSKGFGFVNYSDHESAVKAINDLHNKEIVEGEEKFELYVSKAQKKSERNREIKTRIDALNQERVSKYQGMNLYVKNISDSLTDEAFREVFAPFGVITSARIMRENNESKTSKGFGFICYSSPEEATAAVAEMNNKVVGGKPLVVTLHQRKEHRRAHLAATYAPQGMRFPSGMNQGNLGMPPFMGMYMHQTQAGFPNQGNPRGVSGGPFGGPYGQNNSVGGRGGPMQRGNVPGNMQGGRGGFYTGGMPPFMQGQNGPVMNQGQFKGMQRGGPSGANAQGYQDGRMGPQGRSMGNQQGPLPGQMPGQMGAQNANRVPMNVGQGMQTRGNYANQMQQAGSNGPNMQQGRPGGPGLVKFNNQARNQQGQMGGMMQGMPGGPMQQPQIQQQPSKLDFSDAALASADPLTQKNMIGEHLYPLIFHHQPEQAGKITGMLLEMDNGELLNLIESPDALMSKIEEALQVLRNHKSTAEE